MHFIKLMYMLTPAIIAFWLIVLAQGSHARGIKGFFATTLLTILGAIGIVHWMDTMGWF